MRLRSILPLVVDAADSEAEPLAEPEEVEVAHEDGKDGLEYHYDDKRVILGDQLQGGLSDDEPGDLVDQPLNGDGELRVEELGVGGRREVLLFNDEPQVGAQEGPAELEVQIVLLLYISFDDLVAVAVLIDVLDPLLWDGVVGTVV